MINLRLLQLVVFFSDISARFLTNMIENLAIDTQENLKMVKEEMTKEEAVKLGAEMEFGIKYGDTVSVYVLKDEKGNAFSKEFCGGPHVQNTSELSQFEIIKEAAVSTGVRRIRAVLKAE